MKINYFNPIPGTLLHGGGLGLLHIHVSWSLLRLQRVYGIFSVLFWLVFLGEERVEIFFILDY